MPSSRGGARRQRAQGQALGQAARQAGQAKRETGALGRGAGELSEILGLAEVAILIVY